MAASKKSAKKDTKSAPGIDVSPPNTSAPSENSKSVIVTHRPMMQDSSVINEVPEDKTITGLIKTTSGGEKRVQPLTAPILSPEPETEEVAALETEVDKPEPVVEPEEKPAEPEKQKEPEAVPEAPVPKNENDTPSEEAIAATEEDLQTEADKALQKLIDGKEYFLPINSREKQRSKRFVACGIILSLILIVAWVDIALDANIITLGDLEALTNFF